MKTKILSLLGAFAIAVTSVAAVKFSEVQRLIDALFSTIATLPRDEDGSIAALPGATSTDGTPSGIKEAQPTADAPAPSTTQKDGRLPERIWVVPGVMVVLALIVVAAV